jgi:hypothetical protein
MKAHNLMQAIARANRVTWGKIAGSRYNGMLKACVKRWHTLGDEVETEGGPLWFIEELGGPCKPWKSGEAPGFDPAPRAQRLSRSCLGML